MALDPEVARLLEANPSGSLPRPEEIQIERARKDYERAAAAASGERLPMAAVSDRIIREHPYPLNVRLYTPVQTEARLPILMFFHGGGWVFGSRDSHDAFCRYLAQHSKCLVVSVDYGLAPEHAFPEPLEDCWYAVNWALENADAIGGDASRIGVAGDSAGGNLAVSVCLRARQEGGPQFGIHLLIYPTLDASCSTDSYRSFATGYRLTKELMEWFVYQYVGSSTQLRRDERVSPLLASRLEGLPPSVIITAGYDPLRDEGRAYYERLTEAKIPAELIEYDGMIHGFANMPGVLSKARECLQFCGKRVGSALYAQKPIVE